jgi:class 3 adenylate cyclase
MNAVPEHESLQVARDAAERNAWREAYEAYASIDGTGLSGADLEQYADMAWWTGKLREAIGLRERAYAAFTAEGDGRGAARVALALASDQVGLGAYAVAGGWFANAERLLEQETESVEHGYMALLQAAYAMFAEGDLAAALERFKRAEDIGVRLGDRDLEILGRVGTGRVSVKRGDVEQGLAILDEATAVCGDLRPFSTVTAYCMTISACHDVGDITRAAEWTEVANRWCEGREFSGYPGACRIHRAELLRLRGQWPEAEEQALAACTELGDFDRLITGGGYYEIGEVRRRRGDHAGAEEAYQLADEHGRPPQPGRSLLRLAEGKVDAAVTGITRALQEVREPLARVRLLPAQVTIAVATSDLKAARAARDELADIVDSYKAGKRAAAFDATVQFATGQIALAAHDPDTAAGALRVSRDHWLAIGAPYETAQARMLLGTALRRQGDEDGATSELESALAGFERLGAKLDEARVKELLGRQPTRKTFVFTDIVGSTRLLETLGDEKWKKLLARHNALLRERIIASGGEVVQQTGDGFFAAFNNPTAAIESTIAIQRALDAEVVAPDVRIGLHVGGALAGDSDSNPYSGAGVHLAARIGAAAGAAEILASRETVDEAGTGFRVSEPRAEVFKGFDRPVDVVRIDWR